MTEQERLEAFKQVLLQAEQRFGVAIAAFIDERTYADGQVKRGAGYELALIEGWQPLQQDKSDEP